MNPIFSFGVSLNGVTAMRQKRTGELSVSRFSSHSRSASVADAGGTRFSFHARLLSTAVQSVARRSVAVAIVHQIGSLVGYIFSMFSAVPMS